MISENIQIEKKEKQEFKPLPENVYQVELLDISSEKRATYDTRLKAKEEQIMETVLKFQFTLLAGKDTDGASLRGRNVWENFVPTYLYEGKNGKNKLYQITEALLGHYLSLKEEVEMDTSFLNGLIGKQCRVGIKSKKSGDKIFSNIDTYFSVEENKQPLTDEEIEKAKVKDKKIEEKAEKDYENIDEVNPDDISDEPDPSSIPF